MSHAVSCGVSPAHETRHTAEVRRMLAIRAFRATRFGLWWCMRGCVESHRSHSDRSHCTRRHCARHRYIPGDKRRRCTPADAHFTAIMKLRIFTPPSLRSGGGQMRGTANQGTAGWRSSSDFAAVRATRGLGSEGDATAGRCGDETSESRAAAAMSGARPHNFAAESGVTPFRLA